MNASTKVILYIPIGLLVFVIIGSWLFSSVERIITKQPIMDTVYISTTSDELDVIKDNNSDLLEMFSKMEMKMDKQSCKLDSLDRVVKIQEEEIKALRELIFNVTDSINMELNFIFD